MVHLLPVESIPFFLEHEHCVELVGTDFIKADLNAEAERCFEIERAPDEKSGCAALCGVELIEWTGVAPPAVLRSVRTQPRLAQFIASERPVDQKPERRLLRPLRG
jgi:hypothetical protein